MQGKKLQRSRRKEKAPGRRTPARRRRRRRKGRAHGARRGSQRAETAPHQEGRKERKRQAARRGKGVRPRAQAEAPLWTEGGRERLLRRPTMPCRRNRVGSKRESTQASPEEGQEGRQAKVQGEIQERERQLLLGGGQPFRGGTGGCPFPGGVEDPKGRPALPRRFSLPPP